VFVPNVSVWSCWKSGIEGQNVSIGCNRLGFKLREKDEGTLTKDAENISCVGTIFTSWTTCLCVRGKRKQVQ